MALLKTDVASSQASPNAKDRIDGQKVTGQVLYAEALYRTTGAEAAGDIIDVVTLPLGAVVLPEKSHIACEALGGTGTAISKLGDGSDDDRYSATSVALTSAALTAVTAAAATSVLTRHAVTPATNVVKATVALTSGSVTADRKVVFVIAFRMP